MLLGVLKMYFLTQDTALTSQITQSTMDLLAGNANASALVTSTLQAAATNPSGATGTFNIVYMQAIGSVLPMGTTQILLFFAFALGFAIKVPMFPFHTWLPDAHVEAPTAGSVILAAILLKLGTYGFFRFNLPMFPGASRDESTWVTSFGTFGVRSVMVFLAIASIIYGALAAMYFVVKKDGDVKKLVAYSSVSSMGMVMLGLFAINPNGVNGGVMQMVSHGLYSGALFLLVGIIYERRHTRNVAEFGGLSHVMPGYAAVFLAMVMTAIGLPLLAVFISEFLALRGAMEANPSWAAWGALGIILNAGYFLWLYQRMFFGNIDNPKNEKLLDLNIREWIYMTPLMLMSLWIGVYPKPFLEYIQRPVNAVVRHMRPDYQIPGMPAPAGQQRAEK
jgi:NADH-quinone oxidoreductase subunit M